MSTPKQIIYPLRYLSPFVCTQPEVHEQQFLKNFGGLLDLPHNCLPLGRARTGIYLLVKAMVERGKDHVVMSPYTIPDLVNMVLFAGGVPVFVDAEPRSTNINLSQLEQLLDGRVCAVLATHYHVNQQKLGDLLRLCELRGVQLIEDCAISIGGTHCGHPVGTQSNGVFSLSSYKFLNYLWGGALFCKSQEFQAGIEKEVNAWKRLQTGDYRSQLLRTLKYDIATRPLIFNWVTSPLLKYKQKRSPEIQMLRQPRIESETLDASLQSRPSAGAFREWNSKIASVRVNLTHRRKIAAIYYRYLHEFSVGVESEAALEEGCFVNFPVFVGAERRDQVYKRMMLKGYDVGLTLYPNVHEYEKFKHFQGQSAELSQLTRSVLSLPCHPRVSMQYAEELSKALVSELR